MDHEPSTDAIEDRFRELSFGREDCTPSTNETGSFLATFGAGINRARSGVDTEGFDSC
jgi:hypothetical protein